MMKSLQDQLLGSGLVDGKKAKQISKETREAKKKSKAKKQKKGTEAELNDAQLAARQAKQEKLQRDQALNQQRKQEADKKAIAAQVAQMIKQCKVSRKGGEVEYNFTDEGKVKKILVTQALYDEIVRGRLCIARFNGAYELLPKPVAEKIQERDTDTIVVSNKRPVSKGPVSKGISNKANTTNTTGSSDTSQSDTGVQSDDDYYAQFEIPDDLTW